MTRSRTFALAFAVAGALPVIGVVLFALHHELPTFWDPCMNWGQGNRVSLRLPGPPPCGNRMAGSSETKSQAIVRLVLVTGSLLSLAILGLAGALRGRENLCLSAALVLFMLTIPLSVGLSGLVTLFCGICFVGSWFMLRSGGQPGIV